MHFPALGHTDMPRNAIAKPSNNCTIYATNRPKARTNISIHSFHSQKFFLFRYKNLQIFITNQRIQFNLYLIETIKKRQNQTNNKKNKITRSNVP